MASARGWAIALDVELDAPHVLDRDVGLDVVAGPDPEKVVGANDDVGFSGAAATALQELGAGVPRGARTR
jgi:hypothetical protein